jgi:hypothetical protein
MQVAQLTAIPEDGFLRVNGEVLIFTYDSPLPEVKAIQWLENKGQLEYYDVSRNLLFGSDKYQSYVKPFVDLWQTEKERLEEEANRPPTAEELAADTRAQRDALLASSDWTQLLDSPLPDAARAAWTVYRQALRDITDQPGFPQEIIWPELVAQE